LTIIAHEHEDEPRQHTDAEHHDQVFDYQVFEYLIVKSIFDYHLTTIV